VVQAHDPSRLQEFSVGARSHVGAIAKSISADLLTPVSAFLAIAENGPSRHILLRSLKVEKNRRYALGVRPFCGWNRAGRKSRLSAAQNGAAHRRHRWVMKELLRQHRPATIEGSTIHRGRGRILRVRHSAQLETLINRRR
jgi:hypothetical protein